MLQKKNEGILFSAEIRVVGSYTDRLLRVSHERSARASQTRRRACEARERVLLASFPSLILRFQPRSRPFLTARAHLNTQKYGLFCSLRECSIDLAYSAIRIKGTNSKNHPLIGDAHPKGLSSKQDLSLVGSFGTTNIILTDGKQTSLSSFSA